MYLAATITYDSQLSICIGQKCSALSRLYVASSVWKGGFKVQLLEEVATLKVGPPTDLTNFIGPVMCVSLIAAERPVGLIDGSWVQWALGIPEGDGLYSEG